MAFASLISLERCPIGRGTFIERDERELAVFHFVDPLRVFVMDNTCPHSGGNLSAGAADGKVVTCPAHDWHFRLSDGVCTMSPKANVRTYPVEIRNGFVWADLGEREAL